MRQVTNSVGNGVIYDPSFDWKGDDFHLPPVNELVIYEMHLGTFHGEGDGKSDKFEEAIKRLDHLKRLGVNAIEVMPLAEFAGELSWGYNPACVFAVESDYGGATGFKKFVKAVHAAGIGVILDVVYNHFGPSDLDLWQFDGWSENGMGGIYFYNDCAPRHPGRHPARLRPKGSPSIHPRQRTYVAGGVSRRWPAARHDAVHAQRARQWRSGGRFT